MLLRTLTSLEHSIVTVYAALADIDGLDAGVVGTSRTVQRRSRSHRRHVRRTDQRAGGEPYECPNSWLMDRTLDPLLDHILGATVDDEEIPATDDADRDSLATVNALETIAAATAQQYLERLADPTLRVEVITAGTSSSRRAATSALRANPPPDGYVSPALTEGEDVQPDEEGLLPQFAIPSRFGQLTPVTLVVGAKTTPVSATPPASRRRPRTPTCTRAQTCPASPSPPDGDRSALSPKFGRSPDANVLTATKQSTAACS